MSQVMQYLRRIPLLVLAFAFVSCGENPLAPSEPYGDNGRRSFSQSEGGSTNETVIVDHYDDTDIPEDEPDEPYWVVSDGEVEAIGRPAIDDELE